MTRLRAEVLLAVVTVLWAGTFALVKEALHSISPAAFVFWRFALASVVALAIWGHTLRLITPKLLWQSAVLGVLFGAGFILQSIGLTETTATASAFITGTTVVFIPFVYLIVERRPVRMMNWISTVTVLFGLVLFTEPDRSGLKIGDVLTLGSAVGWAVYIVVLDVLTKEHADDQGRRNLLVVSQFLVTSIIALVCIGVFDGGAHPTFWTPQLLLGLLYCGLLATVVATWLQTNVQRFTHPVRAGIIFSLEPIFASVIALALFSEQWTWRQGAGALVLLAAVIVPDLLQLRTEPRESA